MYGWMDGCMHACMYVSMYIYIYIQSERERESWHEIRTSSSNMSYITLYYHPSISPNYHYHPIFLGWLAMTWPIPHRVQTCAGSRQPPLLVVRASPAVPALLLWSPASASDFQGAPFSSPEAGGLLRETLKIEEVSCYSSPALKCINRSMVFVETGYCDDETIIEN